MGFFSKITKPFKKAAEVVTKPFAKISDKFIPNELRPAMPYLAGIGSLMLPPGMGPYMRALASGAINVGGQIAADESSTGDLSDINLLSTAIAAGYGGLGSDKFSSGMRSGIVDPKDAVMNQIRSGEMGLSQVPSDFVMPEVGFLQGAENIGREGLASLGDYATGGRENLVNLGKNPGSLFSSANKFQGAKDAAKALAPTFSQATGDVAYEAGIDARNAIDAQDAADLAEFESTNKATGENRANLQMTMMRQADIPETTIVETLEMNDLGEYYSPPVETAAYGGLMGRNNYEFGGITEALKNAGSRGLMTENRAMGGMMNGYNMGGRVNFREGGSDIFGMGGEEVIPKMGEKIGEGASSFSNLITDDEGNVYTLLQYLRKFGEDAFFGGQKNPELPENFYNKLGDNYIQEMNEVKERGYNMGGSVLPQGMEMDYRGGGFIPMGSAERADDVDARVSKNEFVMTADAVRAAGGGSVNEGARRMYQLMNNLEAKA